MSTNPPIWTYEGSNGPHAWASLDPSFRLCDVGQAQSPIDLSAAVPADRGDLALSYHLNTLTFTESHRTVAISPQPGGTLSYRGSQFDLTELHFHAPGDHSIGDHVPDLEAHFVHLGSNRSTLVVAVLFTTTAEPQAVDDFITVFPEPKESITRQRLGDIQRIIPLSSPRYRYLGSLTRPPCTEGVEWIVMEESQPVGSAALDAYASRYAPNNRPVQPLNERIVTLG